MAIVILDCHAFVEVAVHDQLNVAVIITNGYHFAIRLHTVLHIGNVDVDLAASSDELQVVSYVLSNTSKLAE